LVERFGAKRVNLCEHVITPFQNKNALAPLGTRAPGRRKACRYTRGTTHVSSQNFIRESHWRIRESINARTLNRPLTLDCGTIYLRFTLHVSIVSSRVNFGALPLEEALNR
jgi:hypothetical protein